MYTVYAIVLEHTKSGYAVFCVNSKLAERLIYLC